MSWGYPNKLSTLKRLTILYTMYLLLRRPYCIMFVKSGILVIFVFFCFYYFEIFRSVTILGKLYNSMQISNIHLNDIMIFMHFEKQCFLSCIFINLKGNNSRIVLERELLDYLSLEVRVTENLGCRRESIHNL